MPAETDDTPETETATNQPPAENLQTRLQQLQSDLEQARREIASLERRQKIDRLLTESDPVDLEVARLLTEAAVEMMDEPDVKLAIDDLRRQKPFLFRRKSESVGAAASMPARVRSVDQRAQAAARRAVESGDRRDLLRYLRLRRGK